MKIRCDREKLLHAFQTVAAVVPTRSPKQILQNVKLEVSDQTATLMATDLDVGIRYDVAGVEIEAPGAAVLPVTRFGSILRESSDATFQLSADQQGTSLRGEHSQFQLTSQDPSEFPRIPEFQDEQFLEVAARLLRELIRRTMFATDNESSRYALGGVLLELDGDSLLAVGTDGRRLARMRGPVSRVGDYTLGDASTIVPAAALQLFDRAFSGSDGEIQLAVRDNEMIAKSPRVTIHSRLLEGRFPRWRDVFPNREESVKIDLAVGPLQTAVRQAAVVTSDESRGIDFTFGGGSLVLSGQTADVGQSRVDLPIAYDGKELTITLDPRFLIDFLKVLDADKTFALDIKDAESAAVCTTDDDYGYVIMPLARDR